MRILDDKEELSATVTYTQRPLRVMLQKSREQFPGNVSGMGRCEFKRNKEVLSATVTYTQRPLRETLQRKLNLFTLLEFIKHKTHFTGIGMLNIHY